MSFFLCFIFFSFFISSLSFISPFFYHFHFFLSLYPLSLFRRRLPYSCLPKNELFQRRRDVFDYPTSDLYTQDWLRILIEQMEVCYWMPSFMRQRLFTMNTMTEETFDSLRQSIIGKYASHPGLHQKSPIR
jgi:hypothetical protein